MPDKFKDVTDVQRKSKTLYVEINGKLVPFNKLPCAKCEWRYSIHCPHGCWNADGKVNVYDLKANDKSATN